MKLLESFKIGNVVMRNRLVMPPMCMFCATDGFPDELHLSHYTTRALGGVGMIIVEATGIEPIGRITEHDLGIWDAEHMEAFKPITKNIKKYGAVPAIQLFHTGRKCEIEGATPIAPSVIEDSTFAKPIEMDIDQIKKAQSMFIDASLRAVEAGFEAIEIHGAHGYLIHQFLSPYTNRRTDSYGGSIENRTRFLSELLMSLKDKLPEGYPILLRLSAIDYVEDGLKIEDTIKIIKLIENYIDAIHVTTGGISPSSGPTKTYPGYQLSYANEIKKHSTLPVIAVGLIRNDDFAESIVNLNQADLVAIGREIVKNPFLPYQIASKHGIEYPLPKGYEYVYHRK